MDKPQELEEPRERSTGHAGDRWVGCASPWRAPMRGLLGQACVGTMPARGSECGLLPAEGALQSRLGKSQDPNADQMLSSSSVSHTDTLEGTCYFAVGGKYLAVGF